MISRTAQTLLGLGLLALSLSGCAGADGGSGAGLPDGWPEQRTFRSTQVTEDGHDRALAPGTRIELRFDRDGRLGANAGCNQLGADAKVEAGRLVLGDIAQTEMGCDADRMAQDAWLAGFLSGRPSWRLTGDTLVLATDTVTVTFIDREVDEPDRPLVGTRWVADTIIQGEVSSSIPIQPAPTLWLEPDGRFTVETGCATIAGRATVTAGQVRFDLDAVPACADPSRVEVHNAVLAVLVGSAAVSIDGDHLTLTGPGGAGVRLTAKG
ncbi:MAG TPA: META domain-containing protein [Micromonosporaceae bacterium]